MTNVNGSADAQIISSEIEDLEKRLADAKARLKIAEGRISRASIDAPSAHHFLLLLSDSALPLGSFAFSSGLESYLAHTRPSTFSTFMRLSLDSYASTTLPFVLAAYRYPDGLLELDDSYDATIMCTVGRRASVAQGRALLSIWERSYCFAIQGREDTSALEQLKVIALSLRSTSKTTAAAEMPVISAHLGPLFGAIASILGLSLPQMAYVFMLSHVKALLSAAVRASMFGPYQAQKVLGSQEMQEVLAQTIDRHWHTRIEDAGQTVPVIDLWIGRHEMLYSRIFNS